MVPTINSSGPSSRCYRRRQILRVQITAWLAIWLALQSFLCLLILLRSGYDFSHVHHSSLFSTWSYQDDHPHTCSPTLPRPSIPALSIDIINFSAEDGPPKSTPEAAPGGIDAKSVLKRAVVPSSYDATDETRFTPTTTHPPNQPSALPPYGFNNTTSTSTATLPSATSGFLLIHNYCPFAVHHWSVRPANGDGIRFDNLYWGIIPPDGWYKEPWYLDPDQRGGMAVKLADCDHADLCPMTQFEYDTRSLHDQIYYDVSNVNCDQEFGLESGDCPFLHGGIFIYSDNPNCPTRRCPSDDEPCQQSFIYSKDNSKVKACMFGGANFYIHTCLDHAMPAPAINSIPGPARGPNLPK